jgi:hypothetical protein
MRKLKTMFWTNLVISNDQSSPINVAIIICVTITFHVDVEFGHSSRIFLALVRFALLADSECHARRGRDGCEE